MIAGVCDQPNVLEVMRIVNIVITIIRIVVPILLLLSLTIDFMKATRDSDEDALNKAKSLVVKRVVASILIFFIPTFVRIIALNTMGDSEYTNCIADVSRETVKKAYDDKMEELLSKAEESLDRNDFNNASNYLIFIKDENSKKMFTLRLDALKAQLKEKEEDLSGVSKYAKVNFSRFKWMIYYSGKGPANKYYANVLPYALWGPEDVNDLNGVSLPLIIWLHGSGELSYNITLPEMLNRSYLKVVTKWDKTGLEPIPAIMIAPQAAGFWATEDPKDVKNIESIKAMIESAREIYNIDTSRIILMGHSLGGRGVTQVSYEMYKRYSKDYFNKLVIFSGGGGVIYPSKDSEMARNYFSHKPVKGFGEPDTATGDFFEWINKAGDYRVLKDADHGSVIEKGMLLDENNDKVSDIVYWMFGKDSVGLTVKEETQSDPTSPTTPKTPDGSTQLSKPDPKPIKDSVNINAVNAAIAASAKSKGLYTREAVVSVAKTTVSQLNSYNYHIPYQLGGMYHRGNTWGLNPAWGTVIYHNEKYVLSGLDCRNFVNWCMKQAGISLIRGFGYEGAINNKYGDKYSNFGDGRPGDVIDANEHIMLIISNDKASKSYTVAESIGGYGVQIKTYTYSFLQNQVVNGQKIKYSVYNMDGLYNNKGIWCTSDSSYRPYKGSCHIPKSEFPSYYGF